jgi:hypothetical protein
MTPADVALRTETYRQFVALGRAPSAGEVGDRLGVGAADVLAGWRRLHDAHALVLDAGGTSSTGSAQRTAGGTRTARGTPSASAPPCTSTAGSRPPAPTAPNR